MNTLETTTRNLPTYWASYFINGDASGMEDGDKADADAFLDVVAEEGWYCVDVSEDHGFRHSNDAGTLAGDCAEYTFIRNAG